MSKKYATDVHHICPTSRWGINTPENKVRLKVNVHRALHLLFNNNTPDEQLLDVLNYNSKVFKKEFHQELYNLLKAKEVEEIYKEWVFKNWIIVPKKFKTK